MTKLQAPFVQDKPGGLVWIKSGTKFGFDDLVFWKGKGKVPFEEVAGRIDLVLTGPHATAAIPRELEPFLEPELTQRQQCDFSDLTTSDLSKKWAEIDDRVVYIEYPHHRILFDPNRDFPKDPEADLREYFKRYEAAQKGEKVSYNGVDGIRPVSFGGVPFLRKPADEAEWKKLMAMILDLAERGSKTYERMRDQLVEKVFESKARYLYSLDMDRATVVDFNSARTLHVNCVHDTMNAAISPDGAVNRDKPAGDRVPEIVSLGNRGDERGEPRPPEKGALLGVVDVPIISGVHFRALQQAMKIAFEVPDDKVKGSLDLNTPYLGAFECQYIGRQLRSLEARGIVRHESGEKVLQLRAGAYQSEFLRELLLGPENAAIVRKPGNDWPAADEKQHADLAAKLKRSYDIMRRWDYDLPPTKGYVAPRFR